MIATTAPIFVVLAIGCLIVDYFALRSNAAWAGHDKRKLLQMAGIWLLIISGLTLLIGLFRP